MRRLRYVRILVSLIAVLASTAWLVAYSRRHTEELSLLSGLSLSWVLLLLGLAILKLTVMGLFTRVVVSSLGVSLSFQEWFGLSCVTSMGNYVSPFRGGAAIRGVYLKAKHQIPYTHFLSTMAALYIISLLANAAIGLSALAALWMRCNVTSIALLLVLVGCLALAAGLIAVIPRLPRLRGGWVSGLNSIIEGCQAILSASGVVVRLLALALANTGTTLLMIHLSFVALGGGLPLVKSLLVSALFLISAMVPITPGGLGIAEVILVLSSEALGVQGLTSVFSVGLNRSAMLAVSLLLGPLFSYILGRRVGSERSHLTKAVD